MKPDRKSITQQRVRELFDYFDGMLIRKVSRGRGKYSVRWRKGDVAGSELSYGYRGISIDYNSYKLHHIIWLWHHGSLPNGVIDHINGNKADNRIENLRIGSHAQNCQNKRRPMITNKLGVQGVYKVNNKYRAAIHKNYKRIHIGYFDTAEEAYQAYLTQKRKLHEFNTL